MKIRSSVVSSPFFFWKRKKNRNVFTVTSHAHRRFPAINVQESSALQRAPFCIRVLLSNFTVLAMASNMGVVWSLWCLEDNNQHPRSKSNIIPPSFTTPPPPPAPSVLSLSLGTQHISCTYMLSDHRLRYLPQTEPARTWRDVTRDISIQRFCRPTYSVWWCLKVETYLTIVKTSPPVVCNSCVICSPITHANSTCNVLPLPYFNPPFS